jgi:hypothetical protein
LGAAACDSGEVYLNLGTAVTLGVHSDEYRTGLAYRTLASLPDGTQYEYEHDSFAPAMGGAPSAIYVDLLQTVAEDWPDAVCVWATFVGDSVEYAAAYVTTWESFMDDAPFTGAEVYYVLQDGQWLVDEWDWYAE